MLELSASKVATGHGLSFLGHKRRFDADFTFLPSEEIPESRAKAACFF